MTDLLCPVCRNPSRDGGLCDNDERDLASVLAEAPDLLDELLTQATRQSVTSIGGAQGTERPLPINLKAADLAAEYAALLNSWALACGYEGLISTGSGSAGYLAARIYDIRIHEAADLLHAELTECARAGWKAVDRHGADLVYIGDCEAQLPPNDTTCGTPLRVRKGAHKATCWRCEAIYDVPEMLVKRDAIIDGSLATAREIADARFRTPDGRVITVRMIEGYAARGTIASHGTRLNTTLRRDVALYAIGDVKEAAINAKYPKARVNRADMPRSA